MFAATMLLCIASMRPGDAIAIKDLSVFSRLDSVVLELPVPTVRTFANVAKSLSHVATSPLDRARAAYVWTSAHIAYSLDGHPNPATALGNLAGDCDAHAAIFDALCKALNVESAVIGGSIRYAVPPAAALNPVSKRLGEGQWLVQHAWNAVRIDGKWGLIDTTMGSASLVQRENEAPLDDYFMADPVVMASDHVPDDSRWYLAASVADLAHSPLLRPLAWRLGIPTEELNADARTENSLMVLRPRLAWRKGMRAAFQNETGSVPDRILLQPVSDGTELRLYPTGPSSIAWLGISEGGRWRPIVGYPVGGLATGRLPKVMTRFYDSGASLSGPFDRVIPAGKPSVIRLRAPGAQAVVAFQGAGLAGKFLQEGNEWVLKAEPAVGPLEVMASYDDPRKFQALLTYDVK